MRDSCPVKRGVHGSARPKMDWQGAETPELFPNTRRRQVPGPVAVAIECLLNHPPKGLNQ